MKQLSFLSVFVISLGISRGFAFGAENPKEADVEAAFQQATKKLEASCGAPVNSQEVHAIVASAFERGSQKRGSSKQKSSSKRSPAEEDENLAPFMDPELVPRFLDFSKKQSTSP